MRIYDTKKEALKALDEKPSSCQHYRKDGKIRDIIWFNGRLHDVLHNAPIINSNEIYPSL